MIKCDSSNNIAQTLIIVFLCEIALLAIYISILGRVGPPLVIIIAALYWTFLLVRRVFSMINYSRLERIVFIGFLFVSSIAGAIGVWLWLVAIKVIQ
ncbi:hypothetical protein V202x_24540 [Gimesia aquarii]|uniref:Uncharacterized protein n=1 Tax=Gimesia aquarii TaxID=2527964 RepID=A0A517WV27_9PLAN|nr:hypothetical protein V202x_24540 [Gimesia aquarii]